MTRPINGLALVRLDELHPSPNNPRERLADIDELAASIREVGLIQPLVVQRIPGQSGFQIIAGHRRLEACQRLARVEIPCIIRRDMLPDEELLAMLVENGQRSGLDPIEEARALSRLKNQMGISETEVARRIGSNVSHVAGRIMLLSLPVEEQEQLRAGVTTLTAAKAKARVDSGRIRPNALGRSGVGHLSANHDLADKAKARCIAKQHKRGKGLGVGGVACGECWETVIRADERQRIHEASDVAGRCLICDSQHADLTDQEQVADAVGS